MRFKLDADTPGEVLELEPSRITGILVRLHMESSPYLLVTLGADGSIERLGRGEHEILTGTGALDLFEELRGKVTPGILRWAGQSWSDPFPRGKSCQLVIGFKQGEGREIVTRWDYGSESPEPPAEILDFVVAAVETTNPWYRRRKEMERRKRRPSEVAGWRLVSLWPT